jgi:hypothetical protein
MDDRRSCEMGCGSGGLPGGQRSDTPKR